MRSRFEFLACPQNHSTEACFFICPGADHWENGLTTLLYLCLLLYLPAHFRHRSFFLPFFLVAGLTVRFACLAS